MIWHWHRTLLGRLVILIALLVAGSQFATLLILSQYREAVVAQQVAGQVAGHLRTTIFSLERMPAAERDAYIQQSQANEGVRIFPAEHFTPPAEPSEQVVMQRLNRRLQRTLGEDAKAWLQPGDEPAVWIHFRLAGTRYWMSIPADRYEIDLPPRYYGYVAMLVLLAILGAWWVVWRINRPIRALVKSARELGAGGDPAPIPPSGPEELRSLAESFNEMIVGLKKLEKDRALLLAGVSHDLRTPLARMRLGAEMMPADNLQEGLVQDIEDMDHVIHQFLSFVRDGQSEAAEVLDLNDVVRRVLDGYRRGGKNIQFQPGPIPVLPLRVTALRRLLANLIDNALKYGAEPVEVRTFAEAGHVVLLVRDHGHGIPAQEWERLLQPFTRLDSARGTQTGTGLGLAIVERIAKLHGGRVLLHDPAPDQPGMAVRVELPMGEFAHA